MVKKWFCGLCRIDTGEIGYLFYLDFESVHELHIELHPRPWIASNFIDYRDKIFVSCALQMFFEIDLFFSSQRLSIIDSGCFVLH